MFSETGVRRRRLGRSPAAISLALGMVVVAGCTSDTTTFSGAAATTPSAPVTTQVPRSPIADDGNAEVAQNLAPTSSRDLSAPEAPPDGSCRSPDAERWARAESSELLEALLENDLEKMSDALGAGADVNELILPGGDSPLGVAAALGCDRLALGLLEHGADANGHSTEYPPLFAAARHGAVTVVEALLVAGADPNLPDEEGYRALDLVAGDDPISALAVAQLLIEHGADPGLRSSYDTTAMDVHAAAGFHEMVLFLAARWPELVTRAALYSAVAENRATTVRLLLDFDSDPPGEVPLAYTDYDSARQLALEWGSNEALAVLEELGYES